MKNVTTPRQLRDGYLKGIGYTPDAKPSPVLFAFGLALGVFIGMLI